MTKWIWCWIARQYQNIGRPSPTALWLISAEQGVGKGVFSEYLQDLLGRGNTTKANPSELTSEWSDWLTGKTLVVADEVNVIEKRSFNNLLKNLVANDVISLRARHIGAFLTPATQSWLFTTNNSTPISLEGADRRHTFVECEPDLERAKAVIATLQPFRFDRERRLRALSGLGTFLLGIVVDEALIERAVTTELKQEVIERTRPAHELWLNDVAASGQWAVGKELLAADAWPMFEVWAQHTNEFRPNRRSFDTGMSELVRKGILRRHRGTGGVRSYFLERAPEGIEPQKYTQINRLADKIRQERLH